MDNKDSELLEKIRQQFDYGPYPRFQIDDSPKDKPGLLYIHNIATPYYLRNQRVIEPEGKLILDAGCGTGYKSLALALANTGAKVIGIDLSERSVELARDRFKYHNCDSGEFHVLSIDRLPSLGLEFDYINCDELLYLFSEPAEALKAMRSVLKPDGIIRSNLHSSLQRFGYFRAQAAFKLMGLMDENPEDMEIDIAIDFIKALKNWVDLKQNTWSKSYESEDKVQAVLMNYLFQGDKGYTILDLFDALRKAELEFISMSNWQQWDLMELFEEPDNLPVFLAISLPEATIEERLHLFELLHPVHRLLDFWCGHLGQSKPFLPINEWTEADWRMATVHLHPQLRTSRVKEKVTRCLKDQQLLPVSKLLPIPGSSISLEVTSTACLFPPLLESPQHMPSLIQRWQQIRPVNLETLEPLAEEEALRVVKSTLTGLEQRGYVFVERSSQVENL